MKPPDHPMRPTLAYATPGDTDGTKDLPWTLGRVARDAAIVSVSVAAFANGSRAELHVLLPFLTWLIVLTMFVFRPRGEGRHFGTVRVEAMDRRAWRVAV